MIKYSKTYQIKKKQNWKKKVKTKMFLYARDSGNI